MEEAKTKEARFKRLATARTNTILKRLDVLGNCCNKQVYSYTKKDIDKIFSCLEAKMKQTKARFSFPEEERFRL